MSVLCAALQRNRQLDLAQRLFPQTLRTTIKGDDGLDYFEDGKKIGEVQREIA